MESARIEAKNQLPAPEGHGVFAVMVAVSMVLPTTNENEAKQQAAVILDNTLRDTEGVQDAHVMNAFLS